jgi:hypothetical protein
MTPETLQAENAELKRKLAEAEKALAVAQRGLKCRQEAEAQSHRTYHDAMDKLPVEAKYLHDLAAQPADMMERMVARAEAAERERDEAKRVLEKHDEAAKVAIKGWDRWKDRANSAELKCAAMAEALRAWTDELRAYFPHDKENGTAFLVAKIESIAALASQPAPEGKPEMSAEESEARIECHGDANSCNHSKPTPEAP